MEKFLVLINFLTLQGIHGRNLKCQLSDQKKEERGRGSGGFLQYSRGVKYSAKWWLGIA